MNTQLPVQEQQRNRQATSAEIDHAVRLLQSLNETGMVRMIENARKWNMEDMLPIVVSDFSMLADEDVLLVGPGRYEVPTSFFDKDRIIIGFNPDGSALPELVLTEPSVETVYNAESDVQTELSICKLGRIKMAQIRIDAAVPTVFEIFSFSQGFSDGNPPEKPSF